MYCYVSSCSIYKYCRDNMYCDDAYITVYTAFLSILFKACLDFYTSDNCIGITILV